jgi:hypothetical protein
MVKRSVRRVWMVAAVLIALAASACAGSAPRRDPDPLAVGRFRAPLLNTSFASAYPRPAGDDPFPERTESLREANSRGTALAAHTPPPRLNAEPVETAPIPERRRSRPDSVYFPDAAAAYVTAVYAVNETQTSDVGASPAIIDIYRYTQAHGSVYHSTTPAVGDLVFFHNTFDRNGDMRNNDWYTHVGLVEAVDTAGNIDVLSYLDGQVSRTRMNLERADVAMDGDGAIVNTTMRRPNNDDPAYTQYLASELFAGFGSLLGEATEFLVIDNWQPGMDVAELR